jgi:hypothetical protein
MSNIVLQESFYLQNCVNCGIAFAVPASFDTERRKDAVTFYCPNGHPQSYKAGEADRLRAQLAEKERMLGYAANRESTLKLNLEKAERARKRLEKRIANGVCPFPGCKRHFSNLHRHIETEHKGQATPALPAATERKLLQ